MEDEMNFSTMSCMSYIADAIYSGRIYGGLSDGALSDDNLRAFLDDDDSLDNDNSFDDTRGFILSIFTNFKDTLDDLGTDLDIYRNMLKMIENSNDRAERFRKDYESMEKYGCLDKYYRVNVSIYTDGDNDCCEKIIASLTLPAFYPDRESAEAASKVCRGEVNHFNYITKIV